MRKLLSIVMVVGMTLPATGCIVRTRSHGQTVSRGRSCPPAHHWNGHGCVHNGRHKGHHKHRH
ncbi:MAG: hypothetical protein AB7O24_13215 [Kofleriaceae bacterium]